MNIDEKFNQILNEIERSEEAYTKIGILGQPGAGKSSLINSILGKKIAAVGQDTDVTKTINYYSVDFLKICDTPGYGTEKFKYNEWKRDFNPQKFDVIVVVIGGKLSEEDDKLICELKNTDVPVFLVRNHSDSFMSKDDEDVVRRDLQKRIGNSTRIYFTSCGREKIGIEELRKDLISPKFKDLWQNRVRKAIEFAKNDYLCQAKAKAKDEIDSYKKFAAVNGLNPIPGLDVSVDIGLYFKMFADIRDAYSIEQGDFGKYIAIPVSKTLLNLMTKEGVLYLLKNMGSRFVLRGISKYIPLIGQVASATISWNLCKYAGDEYLNDCNDFATKVLNELAEKRITLIINSI